MGLFSRIGHAIHKAIDKVGDGLKAVVDSVKSTVQSLGNAIKDIAAVAGCLLQGDIKGAFSKAASALGNLVNVAAFVACPALSMASSFVAGSVGGKAGEALGMMLGGPKALLGNVKDMALSAGVGTAASMMLPQANGLDQAHA